jgi:hypothetical protein
LHCDESLKGLATATPSVGQKCSAASFILSTTGTAFVLNILLCESPMPSRVRTLCRGCRTGLPACISWRAGTTTLCRSQLGWRAGTTTQCRSQLYPSQSGTMNFGTVFFSSLYLWLTENYQQQCNNVQFVQLGPNCSLDFLVFFYTFFIRKLAHFQRKHNESILTIN